MRISLNWLKEFVDIDVSPDELAQDLTMLGLEIESVDRLGEGITNIRIGRILEINRHPDADKLVVCKTDVGEKEPLQIVCGATNMKSGDIVPTAVIGATLPGDFKIAKRKMRGIESQGMMCSARELGLGKDHDGLLILGGDLPIGSDALPILGLDDVIFEIEVTPNRGDWASMIGVARELAARYGKTLRIPAVQLDEEETAASSLSCVAIEDSDLCPRYIGRVLSDVKLGPSPLWMTTRLIGAGIRSINNIVDITNYVLLETGHPLHAFDFDKLLENRIVIRRAKQNETIETLDGQSRKLDNDMLVIADVKHPVAVAGIMGGLSSEVGESTVRVFLESAYFEPTSIRKTARKLGLTSEASTRFQRGADPEMARFAADRAAQLVQEIAGACIMKGALDEYPKPLPFIEINLRFERTDALLGTKIVPEDQCRILKSLAFSVSNVSTSGCKVGVPSWRHDCKREADLIEEVARLHGFGKIEPTLPRVRKTEVQLDTTEPAVRDIRKFLCGIGLTELMNLTFVATGDISKAGLDNEYANPVVLQNPLSENYGAMRTSLIPGILSVVSNNLRHSQTTVRCYEIGPVYGPNPTGELPQQFNRLAIALSGHRHQRHWSGKIESFDVYDLKGIVETLSEYVGARIEWKSGGDLPCFDPAQTGTFSVDGNVLGTYGRIRQETAEQFGIDNSLFLTELDFDNLVQHHGVHKAFSPYPVFPPSLRDMAIIIEVATSAGAIMDAALDAANSLLKNVTIFDVYTGTPIEPGKKSIALGFTFQATDRTLTDEETQAQYDKILRRLQKDFGAQLR